MTDQTMFESGDMPVSRRLNMAVLLIFVLQPLMDILSYWLQRLGYGNGLMSLLRFAVLAATALLGFLLSERKRVYLIFAGCCAFLLAGHCAVCFYVGYESCVTDLSNFIRVAQMPLFTLCFITFCKRGNHIREQIELGLHVNFWLISVSVLLAVLTGTSAPTYQFTGIGVLGWFLTTNSQSAILSILVPILLMLALKKDSFPCFALTTAAGFLQLFFMGPRLAFMSMAVTTVGAVISMLLTKSFRLRYCVTLAAAMLLCIACVRCSPMYLNQNYYSDEMSQKQIWEEQMYDAAAADHAASTDDAADAAGISDTADMAGATDVADEAASEANLAAQRAALAKIYEFYTPVMCKRFGTEAVMEKYNYTQTVTELTATRRQKIIYCELLLSEHPFASKLFGMELTRMYFEDNIFDVENDFHGIFFLYGGVGLVMLVLFLLYFVWRIIRALLSDFKGYFTLEAAGFGMALMILLVYVYCTAGVLRRPNASFYLSVVLAVIYMLTQRRNISAEEKGALEKQ